MANGQLNYSFAVAAAALAEGFMPDIVSTDATLGKMFHNQCVRDLPYVMNKMLEQGMPLVDLVRAVTETPANRMGMEGRIGTLKPGAMADIAIFRLENHRALHRDSLGNHLAVNTLFKPQMTVVDGNIAFCQADFNLFE
jgi:predicted amidohydrolase